MNDYIFDLKKLFFACSPMKNIVPVFQKLKKKEREITINIQKKILDNTVNDILIKRFPIKYTYQKAFINFLIEELRSNSDEIDDDIYSLYCNFISSPEKDWHYRHFLQEHGDLEHITIKESIKLISEGATGLCLWQGALYLAEWCYKNRDQFSGKDILELGSGVGFTGLSIVNGCSPKQYVFSDYHERVLDILCENVRLNLVPLLKEKVTYDISLYDKARLRIKYNNSDVRVIYLKWEDIKDFTVEVPLVYDVILGSDILYEDESESSLITGLNYLLTSTNYAIIAMIIRSKTTFKTFLDKLGEYNLTYLEYDIPEQTIPIEMTSANVTILKIYKKNCNLIE